MTIFFDHQTFSLQEFGGISRYFSELINGINQRTQHSAYLSAHYTNNAYAHDLQLARRWFFPNTALPKKIPLLYRLNKALSTYDLLTQSYDLIHATYYDPYFLQFARQRPTVVTFLDMIHERFSDQFAELSADRVITSRKREVAKRASHIVAISESTKADIVDLFGTDPAKISVIYLGSSFEVSTTPLSLKTTNTTAPYLLFVGHRGYYKNFDPFLDAVAPLLKQNGLRVVCAGGGNFSKTELAHIHALGLAGLVTQQPINDQLLRQLYSDAVAFVFPSLYEGFGIPVLEAFSCDCPCLISDQSSLPEVGGDAVLYFNPNDADSIRAGVNQLLSDSTLRLKLIEKGRQRVAGFSWQRTVVETTALYEKLVQ
ncbi:glycosyltransferase family 4 protein [Fibrella sp. WM1]|uniref:glycosyltransferase family 4 protein n=1 Tax=Fibrella musci TaxID=3242485 RepID=UPI003520C354